MLGKEGLILLHHYLNEGLAQGSLQLEALFRRATTGPWPQRGPTISRIRYRIDTTFGQLVDRNQVKRVWARDGWHLHSRLLRKVLSHALALPSIKSKVIHPCS